MRPQGIAARGDAHHVHIRQRSPRRHGPPGHHIPAVRGLTQRKRFIHIGRAVIAPPFGLVGRRKLQQEHIQRLPAYTGGPAYRKPAVERAHDSIAEVVSGITECLRPDRIALAVGPNQIDIRKAGAEGLGRAHHNRAAVRRFADSGAVIRGDAAEGARPKRVALIVNFQQPDIHLRPGRA